RRVAIRATTAWVISSVPLTVTSSWAAQSAGVDSKNRLRWVAAALLTSTPIGPSSRSTRSTAAATSGSTLRSARTARLLTPSARASLAALGGEREPDGAPQPLPRAGHQHHALAQSQVHASAILTAAEWGN